MKIRLVVSTFALVLGLSGMTPAVAASSGTGASSSSSGASGSHGRSDGSGTFNRALQRRTHGSEENFDSSWNERVTSRQSKGDHPSFSDSLKDEHCSPRPRFGFNDTNQFSSC